MKYVPSVAISEICPERDWVMMLQTMQASSTSTMTARSAARRPGPPRRSNQTNTNGSDRLNAQASSFGSWKTPR